MSWINIDFSDMPEFITDIEAILIENDYNDSINEAVSEEAIWEVARNFKVLPCFTSLYLLILFNRFSYLLNENNLKCDYFINYRDSYFNIECNGIYEAFNSKEDYYRILRDSKGTENAE